MSFFTVTVHVCFWPTLFVASTGAIAMEAVMTNPPITPDEVSMLQSDNLAAGIDSVSSQFGWRPTAPSSWAPNNWAKRQGIRAGLGR